MKDNSNQIYAKPKISWPQFGAKADELIGMDYNVLITQELLSQDGFKEFFSQWKNIVTTNNDIRIYTPYMVIDDASILFLSDKLFVLKQKENCNYLNLIERIKERGKWLILTSEKYKAQNFIDASKKIGALVRVYGIGNDGKIINVKSLFSNKSNVNDNAFKMTDKVFPIVIYEKFNTSCPKIGDTVYTSKGKPITLIEEFISNAQSITYQTNIQGIQAKIYQTTWLSISYFYDKVKLMLSKNIKYEGICWPIDIIADAQGNFLGYITYAAEGYQLKQDIMSQQGLESNFPNWNRRNLTHLTTMILDKIVYLQEHNILFGLVNPATIFVKDENHIYFTEMDSYQIEGFSILSNEQMMKAPELQTSCDCDKLYLYTQKQDYYEIALLVFMILMPGKFPYIKGNNKNISDSIKQMHFAFRYKKDGEEHGAREYFGIWRFAWSHLGNDLKFSFYNTFQKGGLFSSPDKRKDAKYWRYKIESLEKELERPYDIESLRLFPRTFKRYTGSELIKCDKCGVEHPKFYFRYSNKKICNSCLGKPTDISFKCKTCGKEFFYDYATLLKYENLVETKNLSMPTHCPYCRSDKRLCVCCQKKFPVYRLNEKNQCIDCAKIERNKVVKRYYGKCNHIIELTQGEFDFYMRKFGNLPQKCEQCRKK